MVEFDLELQPDLISFHLFMHNLTLSTSVIHEYPVRWLGYSRISDPKSCTGET